MMRGEPMRRLALPFLSLVLVAQDPIEARLRKDVTFLASPALQGRGNGLPGLDLAADYLLKEYQKLGLKATIQRYGWVHRIERKSATFLLGRGDADPLSLSWGRDVEALGWSADAKLRMKPLLFLGFGVTSGTYTDFGTLDLKDRVVVIGRTVPDIPALEGLNRMDRTLLSRVQKLAKAGAAAVLVLEEGDRPARLQREEGPLKLDVPVLSVTAQALIPACGDLRPALEAIKKEGRPQSRDFVAVPMSWVTLELSLDRLEAQLPNVAAVLPGRDAKLKDEYIVVGGHFDHLGMGERHSLAGESGRGVLHPGADDNASGTATVVELARELKSRNLKRSVVFLNVSGEEEGLLGSAHWVKNPTVPLPSVKFMVNFDMVGRLDPEKPLLHIGGLGAPKAALAHAKSLAPQGLTVSEDMGGGGGSSDHTSFSAARIPTFFFITSLHSDYHKPTDTADKVNTKGMVTVTAMGARIVEDLANADQVPAFDPETAKLPSQGRGAGGARIAFGTIPDFQEHPQGFRISGTTPGSTAEAVGMKTGDVLISFGEKPIKNIYDFMEVLAAFKPGDKVIVRWLRDGVEMKVEATLRGR
jgi:hypothetical protein